jgi:hypothetical protein
LGASFEEIDRLRLTGTPDRLRRVGPMLYPTMHQATERLSRPEETIEQVAPVANHIGNDANALHDVSSLPDSLQNQEKQMLGRSSNVTIWLQDRAITPALSTAF